MMDKASLDLRYWLLLLVCSSMGLRNFAASEVEDDVKCLQGLQDLFGGPDGKLSMWQFNNKTPGFICRFDGVTCWNERQNRIISLVLNRMELSGNVPGSLKYCGSLQTLDLRYNDLSGAIPYEICVWMRFLVSLDLSANRLSGTIPPSLGNCSYLSKLMLSGNELSGAIPLEIGNLTRLSNFSVANNDLKGAIPSSLSRFDKENFAGNSGLCGAPLGSRCGGGLSMEKKKSIAIIIAAGVSGAAASMLFVFCYFRLCSKNRSRS